MSAIIVLANLSWRAPNGAGFSNLSFSFARERTGLIGRNGVGKTSLLRLVTGDLTPASGTVSVNGTFGILRQSVNPRPGETIAQLFGIQDAISLLARADAGQATASELAGADWTLPDRVEAALAQAGLSAAPSTALDTLSGGQKTRAALAALVFNQPDFILLDEPTTNLDREGRHDVARLLSGWKSGAIVVSHDRELLESMDAIVELTTLGATRFGGGWSHYVERKALDLAAAHHDLADAEKRLQQTARDAQAAVEKKARKDAGGRRKAARGDMPKILLGGLKRKAENTTGALSRLNERLEDGAKADLAAAREKIEILTPLTVTLASTHLPASRTVVSMESVTAGYRPGEPIIEDFDLQIRGPERIALVGPNGSGKSSILALLADKLKPWSGAVSVPVKMAMMDQRVDILHADLSVRDNYEQLNPGASDNECRASLARFMFRSEAALQITGTLSGGQLLRAGLACTIGGSTPPQLLILDEPTNHLDIQSIESVEAGLRSYDGAILVASHDEAFLKAIGVTRRITPIQ